MAEPRPPEAPGPAPMAHAYLRARPAKQGEGELADRDRHQVHAHGPPVGAPCCGPWGMWKAENAETPLKGVHGVAVPGPVRSVFGVAAVVLVVQDKALRAEQVGPRRGAEPGQKPESHSPPSPGSPSPSPASPGGASRGAGALPPGPPGDG